MAMVSPPPFFPPTPKKNNKKIKLGMKGEKRGREGKRGGKKYFYLTKPM